MARWFKDLLAGRRHKLERDNYGTYVADAVWNRSEELRPDRLGPDETDLNGMPRDKWRPSRTLGSLPWNRD